MVTTQHPISPTCAVWEHACLTLKAGGLVNTVVYSGHRWLAAMVLACTLVACGTTQQDAIVGKWVTSISNQTFDFAPDGSVTLTDHDKNVALHGSYTFTDDTHMRLHMEPGAFEIPDVFVEVDIRGNQMALTGAFSASGYSSVLFLTKSTE